jgi:hypothetical protein
MTMFKKATREQLKARIALDGPSGSGKTYTALRAATAFGSRVAVIDTEHGAASKYAGEAPDGKPWEFDVLELTEYDPRKYEAAIHAAAAERYEVLVIDSLSHAWMGKGGALEMVDNVAGNGNSYAAWRTVTPVFRRMVDAILACPCHVITTMRTKTEYILEPDHRGKMVPRKIGTAPVMRDGIEYEFDLVGDIDPDNKLRVSKTRCSIYAGLGEYQPGPSFWQPLAEWLNAGTPRQLITQDQIVEISTLQSKLSIAETPFIAGLRSAFGVEALHLLTQQQADQLIDRLRAKLPQSDTSTT